MVLLAPARTLRKCGPLERRPMPIFVTLRISHCKGLISALSSVVRRRVSRVLAALHRAASQAARPGPGFRPSLLSLFFLPYVMTDGLDAASPVYLAFIDGLALWVL